MRKSRPRIPGSSHLLQLKKQGCGAYSGAQLFWITATQEDAGGPLYQRYRLVEDLTVIKFDKTIPPLERDQFGGSAGGRSGKTRHSFSLGDDEGVRQSLGITAVDLYIFELRGPKRFRDLVPRLNQYYDYVAVNHHGDAQAQAHSFRDRACMSLTSLSLSHPYSCCEWP